MKYLYLLFTLTILLYTSCQTKTSCTFDLVAQSYNGDETYSLSSLSDSMHLIYDLTDDGSRLITYMNMGSRKDTTIYGGELPETSKGDYDRMKIEPVKGDTLNFRIMGKTDSNSVNYLFEHKIVQGSYEGFLKGDTIVAIPTVHGLQVYHNELKKIFSKSLKNVVEEGSFKIEEQEHYLDEKIIMTKSKLTIHLKTFKNGFLKFSGTLKPAYCY